MALDKHVDSSGPYIGAACVVKLREFDFLFRREPADFIPDPDFTPFFWHRKGDDADDESSGKEKGVEGSTDSTGFPATQATSMDVDASQSAPPPNGAKSVASITLSPLVSAAVITPYNPNPQTPLGIEIVSRICRTSPGLLRSVPVPSPTSVALIRVKRIYNF